MNNKPFKKVNDRYYDTPFGNVPSVTTCLALLDKSNILMSWAVKVMAVYLKSLADKDGNIIIKAADADEIFKKAKAQHKELKEQAAEIGTAVHNLLEVYLKGQNIAGLLEADNRLIKPFEAFKQWQGQYNFELVASEKQVCSHLRFAGTLDCIAKLNGKLYLIDFKSSNAIYNEYFWQVAAYRECAMNGMYFENDKWIDSKYDIEGIGILRLDKNTGLPEFKSERTTEEQADDFDAFMCLCHLWWILNRNKKEEL